MAEMSIKPISVAQTPVNITPNVQTKAPVTTDNRTTVNNGADDAQKAAEAARKETERKAELTAREQTATKEYGPVISRSSDGDTVRVKAEDQTNTDNEKKIYDNSQLQENDKANDAAKPEVQDFDIPKAEYKPFEFPDEVKNNAVDNSAQKEAASTAQAAKETSGPANAASVKNASEAELRRMYLQGDISQTAYNNEEDSRAARQEALKAVNNQFSSEMIKEAAEVTENERSGEAIEALGSDEASETIPLEVRAEFVQNMDNMQS